MPETRREAAVRRSLGRRQTTAEAEVDRLLEVGRELLGSGTDPRVADIVKAAGVSIEAFYRYFGSKGDFVAAVAEDGARRVVSYVEHKVDTARTPEQRLRAAVTALMSQATDPAVAASARHILGRSDPAPGGFEATLAAILTPVLGELGSLDHERDAAVAATLLVARLQGYVWSETSPTKADIEHLVGFLTHALSA
ncbi:hypothetical protein BH11ACT8_BH11ACT8_05890 [soil metagenome]